MMLAHIMGIPVEESVLQIASAGAAIVTAVAIAGRTTLGRLQRLQRKLADRRPTTDSGITCASVISERSSPACSVERQTMQRCVGQGIFIAEIFGDRSAGRRLPRPWSLGATASQAQPNRVPEAAMK